MPDDDTPKALRAYARRKHLNLKNWDLVTGDRAEIFRLGREAFKVDTGLVHNENVYLVDDELRIRGVYNGGSTASLARLAQDAARLGVTE
jgi:protein SCO1/2